MLAIKNKNNLDKKEITRLKIHLSQLKSEERKLQKLVNIAKPAILPSTATYVKSIVYNNCLRIPTALLISNVDLPTQRRLLNLSNQPPRICVEKLNPHQIWKVVVTRIK